MTISWKWKGILLTDMPYLKSDFREELDREVNFHILAGYMSSLSLKDFLGALNYAIYYLVKMWLKNHGESYQNYCSITGTIDCAKMEVYRRLIIPYENKKIKENGDV